MAEVTFAPITLDCFQFSTRTFLLGSQGGFVLHLPVAQNVRDRTLHASKWFGASGFGRAYLEDNLIYVVPGDQQTKLDRTCQTRFVQEIDRAILEFRVADIDVRLIYFLPSALEGFALRLEADGEVRFTLEPEFDMRYYQAFNTRFDGYRGEIVQRGLRVTNNVVNIVPTLPELRFFSLVGVGEGHATVDLLPDGERLRSKSYLKDKARAMAIKRVYEETGERSPDEAPIWDQCETTAYAPARITGTAPLTLLYAFGEHEDEVRETFDAVAKGLPSLQRDKHRESESQVHSGTFRTGIDDVDTSYAHILSRFNQCLVARGMKFHGDTGERDHFNAILAGNKYFLDAWKRDENISLIALISTGDFETVRAILSDTWRYQDHRTGRLPHIIRLGEPLVYYSSDGTLWALERLHRYTRVSGDSTLLDEKWPMVERFFTASLDFVQRGLLPSGGIIDPHYLWETWMDTPYTPRDGYPVEIELLWLSNLRNFLPHIRDHNPALATRLESALSEGLETFRQFYLDGYLADSLSYDWEPRKMLTPNGYIAFALGFDLPPDLARSMILLGREQLAGRAGIRSLAPRDWPTMFPPAYMADARNFHRENMVSVGIYNYHRGIEWLWLNQFFVAGELLWGDPTEAFDRYVKGQVHAALREGGVAGLSELYDAHGPLGADFQAWSMAGFIASLHEFAGIDVDAVGHRVRIRPQIPDRWEGYSGKYRVGNTRFDVQYRRSGRAQCIEVRPAGNGNLQIILDMGVRAFGDAVEVEIDGTLVPREHVRRSTTAVGYREVSIEWQVAGNISALFRVS